MEKDQIQAERKRRKELKKQQKMAKAKKKKKMNWGQPKKRKTRLMTPYENPTPSGDKKGNVFSNYCFTCIMNVV